MIEGYCLHQYKEIDSTNSEAMRMAESGAPDGVVVLAEMQSAGRGRKDRKWISLGGNLHCSIISRLVGVPYSKFSQLSFVVAVAVSEAIRKLSRGSVLARHKWPNDLLIRDKKVCGILIESKSSSDWVVVGIGLNIVGAPNGGTSLSEHLLISDLGRLELLKSILENYEALKKLWIGRGFEQIRDLWMSRAWGVNKKSANIRGKMGAPAFFQGIDSLGNAVYCGDGEKMVVNSGETLLP